MSLLCRLKKLVHKGLLKQEDLDRIVIIPKEQESCDDCISRSKVLEGKVIHQSYDGVEIIDSYAVPVEYIEQLPPVTPKPKTDVLDKIRAIAIKWQNDTWWTDNVSYECMQKIADLIAESKG